MANYATHDSTSSAEIAPIHKLGYDILWTIFCTNAELHWIEGPVEPERWSSVDSPRPFNILRYSSQVCRQWREIILGSPMLWGMVIELDLLLTNEENHWAAEVMNRAGQSPLYVSGWVGGDSPLSRTFFSKLLNENWERIRRLDVIVSRRRHLEPGTWNALFKPSPQLEIIRIQASESGDWDSSFLLDDKDRLPLFADTAPSLREFSLEEVSLKWLSLDAPWLSQLHGLVLSTCFVLNATDVLDALARLPALEHLVLRKVGPPTKQQLKSVPLPNLRSLNISEDFTTSFFLLKWITPGAGCTLFLNMHNYDYILDEDMFNFCKEITRHINNFFGCAPYPRSLLFEPGNSQYNIKGWRGDITDSSPKSRDFSIEIAGGMRRQKKLPISGPQHLTASLAKCDFTHITTFELRPTDHLGNTLAQPSVPFFQRLDSVKHLIASGFGLEFLLDLQRSIYDTIFPRLTTLELSAIGWTTHHSQIYDPVSSFLKWRISAGIPIATLDISALNLSALTLDWTDLDSKFEGLKVIVRRTQHYGVEEYICGTGEPERLNLLHFASQVRGVVPGSR